MILGRSKFETELQVRPDDIDMNRHVHGSRYFDYVLAARFDQMERHYQMPMEEFVKLGFAWVIRTAQLHFKRPLKMGDTMTVRTWIDEMWEETVRVQFEILRNPAGKVACDGYFDYTLIRAETGRAVAIPDWIAAKYSI